MLPRLEVSGTLEPEDVRAVGFLVEKATETDGVRPLSEHVMLHLRYGGETSARNLLAFFGEELVGYAHLDPTDVVAGPAAEVVVHPEHRLQGYGRALVRALEAESPDGRLRLWAHGDHAGATSLATSLGYEPVRTLWQMRRSLYSPLPHPRLPEEVRLRPFQAGRDDEAWVSLNARAFADHPEQGTWTLDDLHARMREDWFSPEGFLIAEEGGDSSGHGARMVGFHWTKVHGRGGGAGRGHAHDPIGEVYVVGVDPDQQARGLGRALTVAGLAHLRGQGLPQAMLYVDADSQAAVRLYTSLGFSRWNTDVMFHRRR